MIGQFCGSSSTVRPSRFQKFDQHFVTKFLIFFMRNKLVQLLNFVDFIMAMIHDQQRFVEQPIKIGS